MKRLIASEIKKIYKSKLNIILIIGLLMFSGYRIYAEYQGPNTYAKEYVYQDIDGSDVANTNYYQKADEVHHGYRGDLSQALIQRMKADYEKVISSYQQRNPDTEYMTYLYGTDYETFLENAKNGVYTFTEVQDLIGNMNVNGYSLDEEPKSENIKAYFTYYYKEDRILSLYSSLYNGGYIYSDTRPGEKNDSIHMDFDQLQDVVEDRSSLHSSTSFKDKYSSIGLDKDVLHYYNQKYLHASNTYDSVIGNTLFVNGLQSLEFTTLLILVLVFANTYAMERTYRIDQILIPSKHGWKNIAIAKMTAGICISLTLVFVQVLMVVVASCFTLFLTDLNLVYQNQANISMNFNVLEFVFTYKEIIFSGILLMSLAALVTTMVTIFFSYITKSRFLTAIPLFFIVLVSGSMNFFDLILPGSYIDAFFPSHMFHFTNFFQLHLTSLVYVQEFFGQLVELRYVVPLFWSIVMVVLILCMYTYTKKHHIVK